MKKILMVGTLVIARAVALTAQTPAPTPSRTLTPTVQVMPPPAPPTLDVILTEARKQTAKYQEVFKNLIATETKTTETYKSDGEMKDRKTVESNFLVYQSSKDAKISSELRNVVKVDGDPIPRSQTNSDQFFAELAKEKTLESELKRIQKETTKYDEGLEIEGYTLNEGIILAENLRPAFDFTLLGTENYQGSAVYVVGYAQNAASRYISFNEKNATANPNEPNLAYDFKLPGNLKKSGFRLRGKLWIDAATFQIRREERAVVAQTANPVTILQTTFEYQPSEYEISVPKQISLTTNEIKKKGEEYFAVKETKVTFDYSKFRKSNVEVVILDDDPQ